jgi:hypothetical protein
VRQALRWIGRAAAIGMTIFFYGFVIWAVATCQFAGM